MSTESEVREATMADFQYLLRFTMNLALTMGIHLNRAVVERGIKRFFSENCHGKYFVLIDKTNKPTGQVIIKPSIFEPWHNSRIVWVDDFQVSPGHDTPENMKKLLEVAISCGVEQQPEEIVRLYCPHNHPKMLHALSLLGFQSMGYLMQQSQHFFFEDLESLPQPLPYLIREASIADIDQIMKLTMTLASVLKTEVNKRTLRSGLEQFLRNANYGRHLLAVKDTKIIGQLVIKHTLMEPWRNSNIIWIDDVYVMKKYRGPTENVARALLEYGTELASRQENERIVHLYCAFSNVSGLAFWSRMGFEPIGYMMQRQQDFGLLLKSDTL